MIWKTFGGTMTVRLNRGEEVMACLKQICEAEGIAAATVEGIGAADRAVVGLYEVEHRRYLSNTLEREMEITSLLGNVSQKDGEVYLHLHATFADEQGRCFGGHLNEARISGTCEIFLHRLDGVIGRTTDEATGLNVFNF